MVIRKTTAGILAWCVIATALASGCSRNVPVESAEVDLGLPARTRRSSPQPATASPRQEEPTADLQLMEQPQEQAAQQDATVAVAAGAEGGGSGGSGSGGGGSDFPGSADSPPHDTPNGESGEGSAKRGGQAKTPPAFPGRPGQAAAMSPAVAAATAQRSLNAARAAVKRGDAATASREAIVAYETAAKHGKANAKCAELMREANRLLDAIGRRQSPRDETTVFE